jgi:hypothetical protein
MDRVRSEYTIIYASQKERLENAFQKVGPIAPNPKLLSHLKAQLQRTTSKFKNPLVASPLTGMEHAANSYNFWYAGWWIGSSPKLKLNKPTYQHCV